ncbi:hypothetical protein KL942_005148 [Ogataea angusta]|uniref:UspA domain-containing protein n=1 Tax=Pichia angusta TaxID=870730 RepID=A0AAN6DB37_PICAN|nr:uncharacterized protein KL928_005345 [Ogataea angusta]KAG7815746.1 hypothetical protein KL928_005345 [Ogataea angusta]KAG7826775.1 hypothetical protein KL920_005218 [Ogataea angusta]KAG7829903.1 hypothetical protein KL943_005274 [Ogataea angusta]KAG7835610.1 hypothetical protein KL942_005148 [Ogataea angusta]KAG7841872.1 hypothetical protein KL941_005277 [Ogataea angusta]
MAETGPAQSDKPRQAVPQPVGMLAYRRQADLDIAEALDDPETKRNTELNSLIYQLSQGQVDELDALSARTHTPERLLRSPSLSRQNSTDSSLPTTNLSIDEISDLQPKRPPLKGSGSFHRGISFENMGNSQLDYEKMQFILTTKHRDFHFDRVSRTFMCGYDDNECSLLALKWTIDEMVSDGDTLVCLRVLSKEDAAGDYQRDYKKEGEKVLEEIARLNFKDKKIKIVLELKVGKVPEMITKAITEYDPVILIVGTHGTQKTGFRAIIGSKSMSKYCLQYAQVPVVVVGPLCHMQKPKLDLSSETVYADALRNFQHGIELAETEIRKPRFQRSLRSESVLSPVRSKSSFSPARSNSPNFSPSRALSPFRLFRRNRE